MRKSHEIWRKSSKSHHVWMEDTVRRLWTPQRDFVRMERKRPLPRFTLAIILFWYFRRFLPPFFQRMTNPHPKPRDSRLGPREAQKSLSPRKLWPEVVFSRISHPVKKKSIICEIRFFSKSQDKNLRNPMTFIIPRFSLNSKKKSKAEKMLKNETENHKKSPLLGNSKNHQ